VPKSQNLPAFLAVENPVQIRLNITSFSTFLGKTQSRFTHSGHHPQKGKFDHIQYSRFPCEILHGT